MQYQISADLPTEDDILKNIQDQENLQQHHLKNKTASIPAPDSLPQAGQLISELNLMVNNEKLSPDLLPSYVEKIEEIVNLVKYQKMKIKNMKNLNENSRKTNDENVGPGGPNLAELSISQNSFNNTLISLMTMEISRIEYLLKSYYRTRLCKIEKFAVYYNAVIHEIAEKAQTFEESRTENDPEDESQGLSPEEIDFYERFDDAEGEFLSEISKNDLDLLHNQISRHLHSQMEHYKADKYLPRKWPQPNEDSYCFARVKEKNEELGPFEVSEENIIDPVVGKIYWVLGEIFLGQEKT